MNSKPSFSAPSTVALSYDFCSTMESVGVLQAELMGLDKQGWCQLLPFGQFKAVDGRPHDVPGNYWQMNAETAGRLITHLHTLSE